jgi:hypothetical protein
MHPSKPSSVLAASAIVAVLAGCGSSGSSGVAPAAYVKSVCNAVAPFEKDVVSRSSALDQSTLSNATAGKKALQAFLNAVAADTGHALDQLKAAGTPNVKNGKAISNAIVSAFTQLKATMNRAVTQSNSLPTDSPTAFKTAANQLGANVRNSMSSIGASLTSSALKSPELEKAAAKEPACKSL